MCGRRGPQWRRGGLKWNHGGSVDQWSKICLTLVPDPHQVKRGIRIRITGFRIRSVPSIGFIYTVNTKSEEVKNCTWTRKK
jgi:hypothetical protein